MRNPFLDAIRAVAILLVIAHHLANLPGSHPEWLRVIGLRGYIGVDLFFVLSGWLIGGQILRTAKRDGRIELMRFWNRRWFRTLPAYYATLGALWILRRHGPRLPDSIFFLQNYTAPLDWILTWSLCIEEHFYLGLPLVLMAVTRFRRTAVPIAFAFIMLSPALRWLAFDEMMRGTFDEYQARFYSPTHLRLDGLVIGVVLAAVKEYEPRAWEWLTEHSGTLAVGGLALALACTYNPWAYAWVTADRMAFFAAVPAFLGVSIGVAGLIPASVCADCRRPRWWGGAATWIAEHAFTLYLTHMTALLAFPWLTRRGFPYWPAVLVSLVVVAFGAWTLRELIEKPGLRLRDWMEARSRTATTTESA
jgi:peptidoglycan/LPS O-acetylase OafA/YrhL